MVKKPLSLLFQHLKCNKVLEVIMTAEGRDEGLRVKGSNWTGVLM